MLNSSYKELELDDLQDFLYYFREITFNQFMFISFKGGDYYES